jgi:Sulfotransferase domain
MLRSYLGAISKLGEPHVREEARLRLKRRLLEFPVFVSYTSAYRNIYHCCVGRTGSQWMKRVLSDPRVFRHSGLKVYTYQDKLPGRVDTRRLTERTFKTAFPAKRIVTPLYVSFENFRQLPKPEVYRAFFIYRDPRDMVVSAYFLRRNTDTLGNTSEDRDYLQSVTPENGLLYIIDRAEQRGVFQAFRSWDSASGDENIRLIRYEDITGDDGFHQIQDLLSFLDISIESQALEQLLRDCSFGRLSGGRTKGQSNRSSHYRKGSSGDWADHFTPRVQERFNEVAGDLLDLYDYE